VFKEYICVVPKGDFERAQPEPLDNTHIVPRNFSTFA